MLYVSLQFWDLAAVLPLKVRRESSEFPMVCTALGINPIHFGIMLIFNLCIGTITPPVGTTLFVGVKVGKVKIETVFRQLLIYFAAIFVVLMLVAYIPQLSLWLPSLMGYV